MPFAAKDLAGAILIFACSLFAYPVAFSQNHAFASADPVRTELLAMGRPGQTIELAREKVIDILEAQNSCSDWFRAANPDPAAVFAGLGFALDQDGPKYITGLRLNSGAMLFKHPYAGSTLENAGLHAVITLNAHGPFFVSTAFLMKQEVIGSSPHRYGWITLEIASYRGNTLPAQIITLLHELAHVIGRIPDDSDELSGQSGRNTQQVLRYCHGAIKTSTRRVRSTRIQSSAPVGRSD